MTTATATATERNANFLADIKGVIKDAEAKAQANAKEALENYRVIGEALNAAKEALKDERGAFGQWVEDQGFTFNKTWRARLMKLAANWSEIKAVLETHPDQNKVWSVDAALAEWTKAKKATEGANDNAEGAGEGEGAGASEGAADAGPKPGTKAALEAELEAALAELEKLRAENEKLRRENERLKAKGAKAETKAETKAEGAKVDAQTKARAAKVWALYQRPGTEGEKTAAYQRIAAMADKFNLSVEEFLKACGLN